MMDFFLTTDPLLPRLQITSHFIRRYAADLFAILLADLCASGVFAHFKLL
jgi:hypothetical protein